jgi:hypothetical protein
MSTIDVLRDRAVLLAEYQAVLDREQSADTAEFRRFCSGARAALEWVLGRRPTTPATGTPTAVTVAAMKQEEQYCDRAIYTADPRPTLDPDYANGIEHALSWARGAEDEPPTPLERAAQPAQAVCTCG